MWNIGAELGAAVCIVWGSAVILVSSLGYLQLWRHYSKRNAHSPHETKEEAPHVTIIRPVKGLDPGLYDCLVSTFRQTYPNDRLTVHFCIDSRNDLALPVLERLLEDFPKAHARIFIEEADPVLQANNGTALGPNPKIRSMSRAYREAQGDIIWIVDCNVWVAKGVCGRMVDTLLGRGKGTRPQKLVHQIPLVVDTDILSAPETHHLLNANLSDVQVASTSTRATETRNLHNSSTYATKGGRLEEMFMSTAHAKFYTAINTVLIAPCLVGKSNMFRRSHLNALTGDKGIDYFSHNICEDHLIGDLLWKQPVPASLMKGKTKNWGHHALVFGDLAVQPMAHMGVGEYVARRVRWLRVRKYTVPAATAVEPTTESFFCSLMLSYGFTSHSFMRSTFGIPQTWTAFAITWLLSVSTWALIDWTLYQRLHSAVSIEVDENTPNFARAAGKGADKRPLSEWIAAWVGREALAFPVWFWAIFGGATVTWRGKKFWVDIVLHRSAKEGGRATSATTNHLLAALGQVDEAYTSDPPHLPDPTRPLVLPYLVPSSTLNSDSFNAFRITTFHLTSTSKDAKTQSYTEPQYFPYHYGSTKRRRSDSESSSEAADISHTTARGAASAKPKSKRRRGDPTMRSDGETPKDSVSPRLSNGSSNGLSPSRSKVTNGHANGKTERNGSGSRNGAVTSRPLSPKWFGHDREEVARVLIQSLTDLGYHTSATALSRESGFELEGPTVAAFRSSVLDGDWQNAEALLFGGSLSDSGGGVEINNGGGKAVAQPDWDYRNTQTFSGLKLADGANKNEMLFGLRQQKYLELLEKGDLGSALMVLRQELTPLHQDTSRLHHLSSLMMCSSEGLKAQAGWDGASGTSRNHLLTELSKSISPSVMIPEHRLAVLIDKVKDNWTHNCLYHNTTDSPSLYVDHQCDRASFPTKMRHELTDHGDEVWHLAFSNDGTKLATASKDKQVFIYDVANNFSPLAQLEEHEAGVSYLAWSPDDTKIITCTRGPDNMARVWDVQDGTVLQHIHEFTQPVSSAAWAPNGETFVLSSHDSNRGLSVWDTEDNQLFKWEDNKQAMRPYDISLSPDGRWLVVLLTSTIIVYDYVTREKLNEWNFDDVQMTSVSISADSRKMLVSMNKNILHLMAIDTGELLQRFDGAKQMTNMIRSAFGGANQNFVISGDEDSRIRIWRKTGPLVETLEAHRGGCVNAVAWHPKDPNIFASAGDDHKVRIWSI
ncbi:hypothetical protein EG328_008364 [Venturia inaequalis]|uniref:Ceramide glucosyltransferase n=1 Tax=Venturia inaequalis TaxID=5025 RepID=A0A8H3Z9W6_VENIN|nr:hypothetical protein EG328_008364 [Venturia inaequalis]